MFLANLRTTTCLTMILCLVLPQEGVSSPEGGTVSAGQATISQNNKKLEIVQQSNKAIIDWSSFDIKKDEAVEFYQPNSQSIILNRINDSKASLIEGQVKANGNIIIINQNGMVFSKDAKIDVNGIIATTADIDNNNFMQESGKLNFNKPGKKDAAIINKGTITVKDAGLVGMVSPNVINEGFIVANEGKVQLSSGDSLTIDMYGDGLLEVGVSEDLKSQLVKNNGLIEVGDGKIILSAAAGKEIVDSLIEVGGDLKANSVAQKKGEILIYAEGSNAVVNNITANKGAKKGSSKVVVAAAIDVAGKNPGEGGGKIQILGDDITIKNGTIIDASGRDGLGNTTKNKEISTPRIGSAGGDIRIGGDYKGEGQTPTARKLHVDKDVLIYNDAINSGDAGRSIFWADGVTEFYGNVFGRVIGGTGNGGFVETSGKLRLDANGYVDLRAKHGVTGTHLLDPDTITIYSTNPTPVSSAMYTVSGLQAASATASINLQATSGITMNFESATLNVQNSNSFSAATTNGPISAISDGTITTAETGSITIDAGGGGALDLSRMLLKSTGTGAVVLNADGTMTLKEVSSGGAITASTTGANHNIILRPIYGFIASSSGSITLNSNGSFTMGDNTYIRTEVGNNIALTVSDTLDMGKGSYIWSENNINLALGNQFNMDEGADIHSEKGNINVAAGGDINMSEATISSDSNITLDSSADMNMQASRINSNVDGNIVLNAGNIMSLTYSHIDNLGNGTITLNANGDMILQGDSTIRDKMSVFSDLGNITLTSTNGQININTEVNIESYAGDIQITSDQAMTMSGNETIFTARHGSVQLTAGGHMTLANIHANPTTNPAILAVTNGSNNNITLNSYSNLIASNNGVTGTAIILAATGNFINNSTLGSAVISIPTDADRLIYSTTPSYDIYGGLASDFVKYNCVYPTCTGTPNTGNGFLYRNALLTVSADNKSIIYGSNGALTYSFTGFINGDDESIVTGVPSLTTSYVPGSSVSGSPYTITLALNTLAAPGYFLTPANGLLTVTPAPLQLTADNHSITYGSIVPSLSYTYSGFFVTDNVGNSITGTPVLTTTYTQGSPVSGSPYSVSFTTLPVASTNYALTANGGVITVNPIQLTTTGLTASDKNYDGTNAAVILGTPATSGAIYGSDAPVITGSPVGTFANANAGNNISVSVSGLALTGSGSNNYALITPTLSADILKTPLILSANNLSVFYGSPLLSAYSFTGFVNGQNASVLTGAPLITTNYTPTSPLGTYPITIALGSIDSPNYDIIIGNANGSITVTGLAPNYATTNPTAIFAIGVLSSVKDEEDNICATSMSAKYESRCAANMAVKSRLRNRNIK
jgi:filamentous hemagglutinin family protein